MSFPIQPIYLLADSQLLFQTVDGRPLLENVCQELEKTSLKAAYIGASNGDEPMFFSLFEGAMDLLGIEQRRHIMAAYDDEDQEWLKDSDLILLAGGDVARGWTVLDGTDMKQDLIQCYYSGTILVGISAGAIQLGLGGWEDEEPLEEDDLLETFKLIPFYLDAHDEDNKWQRLRRVASAAGSHAKCIGIPKGGGMIYHPDHTLEPVRQPLVELSLDDTNLVETLLFPPDKEESAVAQDEAPDRDLVIREEP